MDDFFFYMIAYFVAVVIIHKIQINYYYKQKKTYK